MLFNFKNVFKTYSYAGPWKVSLKPLASSLGSGFVVGAFVRNSSEVAELMTYYSSAYPTGAYVSPAAPAEIANLPGSSGMVPLSQGKISFSMPSSFFGVAGLKTKRYNSDPSQSTEDTLCFVLLWQFIPPATSTFPAFNLFSIKVTWQVDLFDKVPTAAVPVGAVSYAVISQGELFSLTGSAHEKDHLAYFKPVGATFQFDIFNYGAKLFDYSSKITFTKAPASYVDFEPGNYQIIVDVPIVYVTAAYDVPMSIYVNTLNNVVLKLISNALKPTTASLGIFLSYTGSSALGMRILATFTAFLPFSVKIVSISDDMVPFYATYPSIIPITTSLGAVGRTPVGSKKIQPTTELDLKAKIAFMGIDFAVVVKNSRVFPQTGGALQPASMFLKVLQGMDYKPTALVSSIPLEHLEAICFGLYIKMQAESMLSHSSDFEPTVDKIARGALENGDITNVIDIIDVVKYAYKC